MSNINIEILFQSKIINFSFYYEKNEKELYNKFIGKTKNEINFKEDNKKVIFKLKKF